MIKLANNQTVTLTLLNDPDTPYDYVPFVLMRVLVVEQMTAEEYTAECHCTGDCKVYEGSLEECQSILQHLHRLNQLNGQNLKMRIEHQ